MKHARLARPALALSAFSLALAVAGCADKKASVPPLTPVSTTAGRIQKKAAGDDANASALANADGTNGSDAKGKKGGADEGGVSTQSLHMSEEIAQACNLPVTQAGPHFDFDSATLPDQDRELLAAFAKCLAGPLKGKGVLLIGRADPRGEGEYNMGLGGTRSETVKRYLLDLGVADAAIKATSRGEMDATGTDEDGWAKDRRVDIDVR